MNHPRLTHPNILGPHSPPFRLYSPPMPAAQPSPARIEAFSDGVIAVIITIMVLEFKVPRDPGPAAFLAVLPTLLVYLLSFTFTGIYWINHHHMIDRLKRVDALILWCNLALLFFLSLLPFFTANLIAHHLDSFSVSLYAASLFADGLAFTVLGNAVVRHIRRSTGHLYDPATADDQAAERKKGIISLLMYFTAVVLAFWHPYLALALVALVTLIWIVPTFGVRTILHDPTIPPAP